MTHAHRQRIVPWQLNRDINDYFVQGFPACPYRALQGCTVWSRDLSTHQHPMSVLTMLQYCATFCISLSLAGLVVHCPWWLARIVEWPVANPSDRWLYMALSKLSMYATRHCGYIGDNYWSRIHWNCGGRLHFSISTCGACRNSYKPHSRIESLGLILGYI